MNGVLSIHKPKGPTSHDVVARLRRLAKTRRVGHAGTLDPMAEGVLVCCLGAATRVMPWLVGLPKEYTGEILLGVETDSYDAEGRITREADPAAVDLEALKAAFHALTGLIEQQAPPYSAVKVDGKKLYEYARRGEEVPVKRRSVFVERFEVVRFLPPRALFQARVGSGTYIRSLAHSVGAALGCGAHLTRLVRSRVGGFDLEDSISLEALELDPENLLPDSLLSIEEALTHLPKLKLLGPAEARLRHGGPFQVEDIAESETLPAAGQAVLILGARGEALAVCQADTAEGPWKPLRVLVGGDELD
jgi:tRNA pseudouridine55 synthase